MQGSLSVYFTPGAADRIWREAVVNAAVASGWAVDRPDEQEEHAADDGMSLGGRSSVLSLRAKSSEADPDVGDSAVIFVLPITRLQFGEEGTGVDVIRLHSERLSQCAQLARDGVASINGEVRSITLPGLGAVACVLRDDFPGVIEPALTMYSTLPLAAGAKAVWRAALFQCSARRVDVRSDGDVVLDIDLTGAAGALLSGPYIHLPKGRWRLRCVMEIDPQGRACQMAFDWGDDHHRVNFEATPSEAGLYEVILEVKREESWRSDFRILTRHPHFTGKIIFSGCDVEYLGDSSTLLL